MSRLVLLALGKRSFPLFCILGGLFFPLIFYIFSTLFVFRRKCSVRDYLEFDQQR